MKIHLVGAELFHANRRTEGRADNTKLIDALRNSDNAHKYKTTSLITSMTNHAHFGSVPPLPLATYFHFYKHVLRATCLHFQRSSSKQTGCHIRVITNVCYKLPPVSVRHIPRALYTAPKISKTPNVRRPTVFP
jgi:hypothetical protein